LSKGTLETTRGFTEFAGSGRLSQVLEYLGRRMGLWLSTFAFLHDIAQARRSPIGTAALRDCVYFCLVASLLSHTSIGGCFQAIGSRSGLRWRRDLCHTCQSIPQIRCELLSYFIRPASYPHPKASLAWQYFSIFFIYRIYKSDSYKLLS
jgi:hypothetical protein